MVWEVAVCDLSGYNAVGRVFVVSDGNGLRRCEQGKGSGWKERAMRVAFPNRIRGWVHVLTIAVVLTLVSPGGRAEGDEARPILTSARASKVVRGSAGRRAHAMRAPYAHFAEIEVTLSESLTAADLTRLPRAPGSRVRLLEGGKRATAQLAATVVGDLIEQGQDVTVVRDFLLSERRVMDAEIQADGYPAGVSLYSQGAVADSNEADQAISEWDWIYSSISLSGAPSKAVVTTVDVHFEIVHPAVEELCMDLCDETRMHRCNLWLMNDQGGERLSRTVTGITEFAGEQANQTWVLRSTDVRMGNVGYVDSWWIKVYYDGPWDVGTHDDREHPVVVEGGAPYASTTLGATGQLASSCGYRDALDVWHSYTAMQTGPVTVRVESDEFDTTVAVFDPPGAELACGDDDCESTNSVIVMWMAAGKEYLIRVAGYEYETGAYSLVVIPHVPAPVARPDRPSPADGADVDQVDIVLSWNDGPPAADAVATDRNTITFNQVNTRQLATIYGEDGRREEYEMDDPLILAAGSATAALIYASNLVDQGDGTFQMNAQSFAWWYQWLNPLDTGHALCPDEPFRDQPSVGMCTGVLVAPDLVLTAGHCVSCDRASDVVVVFDFVMEDALTPTMTVRADQVYQIEEIVGHHVGYPDWGLIRLDRQVVGRTPLPLRRAGRVADGQRLLVIGHPWGIPRKYDAGATVRQNTEPTFFQANLDTYQGNSGSPVINLDSMEVEGILCRGMEEFVEDVALGCDRSLACPDTGCPSGEGVEWEDVTRATTFSMMVPGYDVYLGTDPMEMDLVAATLVAARYRPQGLRKDATYYWQVVVRHAYGQVEGPVWSFRTALSPERGSGTVASRIGE